MDAMTDEEFGRRARQALANLYDPPTLQANPLAARPMDWPPHIVRKPPLENTPRIVPGRASMSPTRTLRSKNGANRAKNVSERAK